MQRVLLHSCRPRFLFQRSRFAPTQTLISVRALSTTKPEEVAPDIDFNQTEIVYQGKKTSELVRSLLVLSACQIRPLVSNAEFLLNLAKSTLGSNFVDFIVRPTFFAHFCAGEDQETIKPTIEHLRKHGIGSILDYAAENDDAGVHEPAEKPSQDPEVHFGFDQTQWIDDASDLDRARKYHYEGEEACDAHEKVFIKCIEAVHNVTPGGFAAVKLTALGPPLLLRRMSKAIVEIRNLFDKFESDVPDGLLTHDEFIDGYKRFFVTDEESASLVSRDDEDPFSLKGMLHYLDPNDTGVIDYVEWSHLLRLEHLEKLTSRCKESGPLSQATLKDWEIPYLEAMVGRIDRVAKRASELGVRLMIDAEQTYHQPAIDNTVFGLQQTYNRIDGVDGRPGHVTVFNTYQCYLRDSLDRLKNDLARAKRHNYHFGAKMVRGAYMETERSMAAEAGLPSPIFDTLEGTHKCYDAAVDILLDQIAAGERTEFMVASHNQQSVEHAVRRMREMSLPPDCGVHFGQLLGMSDQITYNLGTHGFSAYKYVPYGKVSEVTPYLVRRAQENSSVMGTAKAEMKLVNRELLRRAGLGK